MPKEGFSSITVKDLTYNILVTISDKEELSVSKTIEMLCKLYYLVKVNPTDRERMEKLLKKAKKMKIEKLAKMLHIPVYE